MKYIVVVTVALLASVTVLALAGKLTIPPPAGEGILMGLTSLFSYIIGLVQKRPDWVPSGGDEQ